LRRTRIIFYLFVLEARGITIFLEQALKGAAQLHGTFTKIEFITIKTVRKNPFTSCCFCPNPTVENSGYLYAAFANGSICQYDAQLTDRPSFSAANTAKIISQTAIFHVQSIARENVVLAFSYNRQMGIFNPRNHRVATVIKNPNNVDFVSACYDDDCQQYIFSDALGFLYIWEVYELTRLLLQTQFNIPARGGVDAERVYGKKLTTDDLEKGLQVLSSVNQLVPASPGKFLFLGREGIWMIDINRGTVKRSYQIHSGTITYISIARHTAAQGLLVTAGDDRMIKFWDPVDVSLREEQQVFSPLPMLSVYVGVRDRPGTNLIWAVTGHDEGKLYFYNITDHKHVELPSRHRNSISHITVVELDMKVQLLSVDYDGIVALWSIDSIIENLSYAAVSLIKTWRGSEREILSSAGQWMPEQQLFATGGNDRLIHLWTEVDQQFTGQVLRGHTDSVTAIVFEGFFLITGGEDLTIRIWDTINMVQLTVITRLHTAAVRGMILLGGESKFASCDASGLVAVYDYVQRKALWTVKHSADSKCIFLHPELRTLFVCVKSELVPHELGDGVLAALPAFA
jgi:WD40 repeat protein